MTLRRYLRERLFISAGRWDRFAGNTAVQFDHVITDNTVVVVLAVAQEDGPRVLRIYGLIRVCYHAKRSTSAGLIWRLLPLRGRHLLVEPCLLWVDLEHSVV